MKRFGVAVVVLAVVVPAVLATGARAEPPASAAPPQPAPAPQPTAAPSAPVPAESTRDLVNNAKLDDGAPRDGFSPAILRAEVMLDRLHVSPGVIDGRAGKNVVDALAVYEKSHHLKVTKGLDAKVWTALVAESGAPVLEDYTLTDADVAGPFVPDIPKDYAKQAELKALAYRTPSQKIAAKFHMSERLLAALNPGVDLGKAGTRILATIVTPAPVHGTLKSIVVDKSVGEVLGYDRRGHILVGYPATIGSRELPSPSGTYKVKGVAWNPIYYYDPKNFVQGDNKEKLKLPPGPNNPVGTVFIALTKPTYGLHGTPDPDTIDKTASHGCVRMTNWDASELAKLVRRGMVVRFRGK